ncbi:hypothetical protein [Erythrobacter sp. R86502]|uniref:hypothetical protein n=1 Tax=Erythrobacter sp. R86502 TaxID=3093846 RepID=UPI0036D20D94
MMVSLSLMMGLVFGAAEGIPDIGSASGASAVFFAAAAFLAGLATIFFASADLMSEDALLAATNAFGAEAIFTPGEAGVMPCVAAICALGASITFAAASAIAFLAAASILETGAFDDAALLSASDMMTSFHVALHKIGKVNLKSRTFVHCTKIS